MKRIFLTILFLCCAGVLPMMAYKVTGKVNYNKKDGTKEPLEYATVAWVEGKTMVNTVADGTFEIKNLKGTCTLVASFIGFTRDTIVVNGEEVLEMELFDEDNTLASAVITARRNANYLAKGAMIKTEVITAAGLCKMACCSLAESFENSASVSVGYSDAVSGAKQIKLLGLSGAYTQMLDENRPVMRGLAAPFGLTYVPGQWLQSIQISKGPSSVTNGLEGITGQINMEHRKPTDEVPLYLNLFEGSNLRSEANIASSIQINNKLSTVIMAHATYDAKRHDDNHDSFSDDPMSRQWSIDNRWLYVFGNNAQLRWGVKALTDTRVGGQMDYSKGMNQESTREAASRGIWGSEIRNSGISGYAKLGIPLNGESGDNIAFIADYSYYDTQNSYGLKYFDGHQNMGFFNGMYHKVLSPKHSFTVGLSGEINDIKSNYRMYSKDIAVDRPVQQLGNDVIGLKDNMIGAYGEYTNDNGGNLTLVTGVRVEKHSTGGWSVAPRANVKYSITDNLIFRATVGRGLRNSHIIADNLGVLSSSRKIEILEPIKREDAWTFGGNITQNFALWASEESYISFDYFRSQFHNQAVIDWDLSQSAVSIYNCSGKSFTDTYQIDLSLEPIERFTTLFTFRYTNAKVTMNRSGNRAPELVNRPLTSTYKGVVNLQYATPMNKWTFDFTAQVNGPVYLPEFMGGGKSSVYPMLYAQITKKFRGVDIYAGVENITDYTQDSPILDASAPFSDGFNAAMVWGPLMGRMFYIGMRLTIWK